jgi:hypothetical protein
MSQSVRQGSVKGKKKLSTTQIHEFGVYFLNQSDFKNHKKNVNLEIYSRAVNNFFLVKIGVPCHVLLWWHISLTR